VHVTSGAAIFKLALWWRSVCLHYTATYRIVFIALVTCLPTYRTMARYFEFLSQFYGFHLTHPRRSVNVNAMRIRTPSRPSSSDYWPNGCSKHSCFILKKYCFPISARKSTVASFSCSHKSAIGRPSSPHPRTCSSKISFNIILPFTLSSKWSLRSYFLSKICAFLISPVSPCMLMYRLSHPLIFNHYSSTGESV
jgi:hypothetical protein